MTMSLRQYFSLRADTVAIPALDGLRGIAILMVVAYHGTEAFAPTGAGLLPVGPWDLATPIYSGWMGVNLFFVLSGFLITYHLLRRWTRVPDGAGLRTYLVKRWLRIVPTYYVVLAIAAAGVVPHHPIDTNLLSLQVAWHALFLQDYLPSSILGPFWSLGVEEKFYLLMPLVLLVAWRLATNGRAIALLAGIAALPLAIRLAMWMSGIGQEPGVYIQVWRNPFHLNLDALFLGALAAWVVVHRHALRVPGAAAAWSMRAGIAVLSLIVLAAAFPGSHSRVLYQVLIVPLSALGMAGVVLGTALAPRGRLRVLEGRWLARAGKLAYPWYLTHVLIMWWAWGDLQVVWPGIVELAPAVQFGVFLPLYLASSVLTALLVHFAVEKPFLILKDRVGVHSPSVVQVSTLPAA